MNILPITLIAVGLAAIVNIWLSIRVGQVRTREKVSVGDGGNDAVIRRMRAHSNYIENTPFFLALVGAIELAMGAGHPAWLYWVVAAYFVGRVAHAFGMDDVKYGRIIGTLVTLLSLLGLGLYALSLPYRSPAQITVPTQTDMQAAEEVPQN